jgi:hypothetical protein
MGGADIPAHGTGTHGEDRRVRNQPSDPANPINPLFNHFSTHQTEVRLYGWTA